MNDDNHNSLLEKVSFEDPHTPSLDEWEIELGRLLAGERDYVLIQVGIASYVDRVIAKSHDQVLSRWNFAVALRNSVASWQPHNNIYTGHFTFGLLELLAAYQPTEGFTKVLGFMQQGLYFPVIPLSRGGYGAGQDLHKKALVTLEYYYPTAHPKWKEDPAFISYLDLLDGYLQDERFCSYAIGRLVVLNIISIQEIKVRRAIELNLQSIDEIVSFLTTQVRLASREKELSEVYAHCFLVGEGAKERFERVLKGLGISLTRLKGGTQLELQLPGSQGAITLDFPEDSVIVEVLERGNKRGAEAAKALAAAAYN